MVVAFTNPTNGAAFPNPVTGTYDLTEGGQVGGAGKEGDVPPAPTVTLTVSRNGTAEYNLNCVVTPGGGTGGTWSVAKPNPLATPVNNYVLVATLSYLGNDAIATVTGITN